MMQGVYFWISEAQMSTTLLLPVAPALVIGEAGAPLDVQAARLIPHTRFICSCRPQGLPALKGCAAADDAALGSPVPSIPWITCMKLTDHTLETSA
ncbi:palmitoyltransferase ZDHHC22 isoform 2-T7 [Discoglossus pictus]